MDADLWTAVDGYLERTLVPDDAILDEVLRRSRASGLPVQEVSRTQGKLLRLLAEIQGARALLELGTLGGYSTIWLGRALSTEGRLISLEANPITPRSRLATSPTLALRIVSGSAAARLSRLCHGWSRKGIASISSSSTPTSRAIPTISVGRCACRASAR
jgi:hypothetical protein